MADIRTQLGYKTQTPNAPASPGSNAEGYAARKDQAAKSLAASGDTKAAMDAAQARNTYMYENGQAYQKPVQTEQNLAQSLGYGVTQNPTAQTKNTQAPVGPTPEQFSQMNAGQSTVGTPNPPVSPTQPAPAQNTSAASPQTAQPTAQSSVQNINNGASPTAPVGANTNPANPATAAAGTANELEQMNDQNAQNNESLPGVFQGQLDMGGQLLEEGTKLAEKSKATKDSARKNLLMKQLGQTNAADALAQEGKTLSDLTIQQLEELATTQGIELTEKVKERLKQGGKYALESLALERGDRDAELDYNAKRLAREKEEALDERTEFNAQQDVRMRRMAAAFGGGSVSSMSGNAMVMNALEKGQKAVDTLRSTYSDMESETSRQKEQLAKEYGMNTRKIESDMAAVIEDKYTEISNTIDDLIQQGITDEDTLNEAVFGMKKDYAKLYGDVTTKAAEYMQKEYETFLTNQRELAKQQFESDKFMTESFGTLHKDGVEQTDAEGNPIPTMEALKTENEMDYKDSEQAGYFMRNGKMVPGLDGKPIPVAEMSRFLTTEARAGKEFETTTGLRQQEIAISARNAQTSEDRLASEQSGYVVVDGKPVFDPTTGGYMTTVSQQNAIATREMNMAEKGLQYGGVDTSKATSSFNPANSKYGITAAPDGGINIGVQTKTGADGKLRLTGSRVQCGEFVNDVLGIPGFMGNTLESKKAQATSQVPVPGSAFVTTEGTMYNGKPTGHTGIVKNYVPGGPITIAESNFDGKGNYREKTYPSLEAFQAARPVVGFTGGLQQQSVSKKPGAAGTQGGAAMDAKSIVDGTARLVDFPQDARSAISQELSKYKAEALKTGDLYGVAMASAGGKDLSDTQVQQLSQIEQTAGMLTDLENTIKQNGSGPLQGIVQSNNPYDAKAKQIAAQVTGLLPSVARGVFGEVGVLTDADMERYKAAVPNLNSPEAANELVSLVLRDTLKKSAESKIKAYANSGRDVSGFGYLLEDLGTQKAAPKAQINTEALKKLGGNAAKGTVKAATGIDLDLLSKLFR